MHSRQDEHHEDASGGPSNFLSPSNNESGKDSPRVSPICGRPEWSHSNCRRTRELGPNSAQHSLTHPSHLAEEQIDSQYRGNSFDTGFMDR